MFVPSWPQAGLDHGFHMHRHEVYVDEMPKHTCSYKINSTAASATLHS